MCCQPFDQAQGAPSDQAQGPSGNVLFEKLIGLKNKRSVRTQTLVNTIIFLNSNFYIPKVSARSFA